MSFFYIEKNYVRKQKELSLIGMIISLSYKKSFKRFLTISSYKLLIIRSQILRLLVIYDNLTLKKLIEL